MLGLIILRAGRVAVYLSAGTNWNKTLVLKEKTERNSSLKAESCLQLQVIRVVW